MTKKITKRRPDKKERLFIYKVAYLFFREAKNNSRDTTVSLDDITINAPRCGLCFVFNSVIIKMRGLKDSPEEYEKLNKFYKYYSDVVFDEFLTVFPELYKVLPEHITDEYIRGEMMPHIHGIDSDGMSSRYFYMKNLLEILDPEWVKCKEDE